MKGNKKVILFGLMVTTVVVIGAIMVVGSTLSKQSAEKNYATRYLTADDNGTTLHLKKGDTVNLELKDYGDGGYTWEIVSLDETIVSLTEKTDSQPSGLMGDFGNDIWVFTAEKTGSTTLELKCSRPWDKTDVCATFTVELEVQ
jgi:predicted secreted protein